MTDAVPPGGGPGDTPQGHPVDRRPAPLGRDRLRASDADREQVAERLRDAMAEGRLDMTEFQERLEAVYQAKTYGELAPITRDLPAPEGGAAAGVAPVSMTKSPAPAGSEANWPARIGAEPTSSWAFALWSGFQRRGRWAISRVFSAYAVWGGGEIDLREAAFEDRDITIRCFAFLGGIQITVPPELNVHVSGAGVLGGFGGDDSFDEEGHPDAPRVRVTGFALLGGVGVERRLTRAEKARLKEERRRLGLEDRRYELEERDRRGRRRGDRWARRSACRARRRAARADRISRRYGHRGDDY